MGSKSQNINNTVAAVLDTTDFTQETIVDMFSIANRTAAALTFDVFKYDGTNSYYIVPPGTPIAPYAPIILSGIKVQPNWILKVTTSGSCDVDCNYKP